MISDELYLALVQAEAAAQKAHNLCYADGGAHGAGRWMAMQVGKAQSILIHYVVKHADRGTSGASLQGRNECPSDGPV